MQRKIFKTGHSAAVTLSQDLMKDMDLEVGSMVKLEFNAEKKQIIISQAKKENQLVLGFKVRKKL